MDFISSGVPNGSGAFLMLSVIRLSVRLSVTIEGGGGGQSQKRFSNVFSFLT